MLSGNPPFPEQASTIVSDVDKLYFLAVAVTAFFALLVVISVVVFAIKHRERTGDRVGAPITGLIPLELGWSIVPFVSSMAIFGWATVVFFDLVRAPDQTVESYATGIGRVIVQEPNEYQTWLSGRAGGLSMTARGERLFHQLGCVSCHLHDGSGRGPSLAGNYGARETLSNGATVNVDDTYIRESILTPRMRLVAGHGPVMSTFQDQVNEEGLTSLVEYIKSIPVAAQAGAPPAPAGQGVPR